MTIRTVATLLSIEFVPFLGNRDFQPGTVARTRFDHQVSADGPDSFLDDRRTAMKTVQLTQRQTAAKRKTLSIVVNDQSPQTVLGTEAHVNGLGTAVLSNVDQPFLHHPDEFPAGGGRKRHLFQFRHEPRIDSSIAAKTFYDLGHKVKELIGADFDWPHALHQFPQIQHLFAEQVLDAVQFRSLGAAVGTAPQHIDLHLNANERLNRSVMQFPRHAGPFHCARARPQPPEQVNRIKSRGDLPQDVLGEPQFALPVPPKPAIDQNQPARPFASDFQFDYDKRVYSAHRRGQIPRFD